MVNINFDLKDVTEIKIGRRTFKAADLKEADVGDFLLYVGESWSCFTSGKLYSVKEVCCDLGTINVVDDEGDKEPVDMCDSEFVLLKAEYTEREKEFVRFGRQPEQFEIGDVVQLNDGAIGVIKNLTYDNDGDRVFYISGIGSMWVPTGTEHEYIRLIAPAKYTNTVK